MTDKLMATDSKTKSPPLTSQAILLIAIEELDLLVSELIRTARFSVSQNFHDWVADSLTNTVETRLLAAQQSSRFQNSLGLGHPREVLAHWVRHWACLEIKKNFGQYEKFCPCGKSSDAPHKELSVR